MDVSATAATSLGLHSANRRAQPPVEAPWPAQWQAPEGGGEADLETAAAEERLCSRDGVQSGVIQDERAVGGRTAGDHPLHRHFSGACRPCTPASANVLDASPFSPQAHAASPATIRPPRWPYLSTVAKRQAKDLEQLHAPNRRGTGSSSPSAHGI
jgi:hypothetical protein